MSTNELLFPLPLTDEDRLSLETLGKTSRRREYPYCLPVTSVRLLRSAALPVAWETAWDASHVAAIVAQYLRGVDREHVVVLPLAVQKKILGISTVHIGSVSGCVFHPREIFKVGILSNAVSLLVAHNHPSGDPRPSAEDVLHTKHLTWVGEIHHMPLTDHVIIGDGTQSYYSFADSGQLNAWKTNG